MSDVSLVAQTETRNGISFFRARLRFAIETNVRELNYSRGRTGEFSTRRQLYILVLSIQSLFTAGLADCDGEIARCFPAWERSRAISGRASALVLISVFDYRLICRFRRSQIRVSLFRYG